MRDQNSSKNFAQNFRKYWSTTRAWARSHLPPGLRLGMGLVLIVGGIFGFLPILGFWMIPLGISIAALDIMPIWRWLTGRRRTDAAREEESSEDR